MKTESLAVFADWKSFCQVQKWQERTYMRSFLGVVLDGSEGVEPRRG